MVDRLVAVDDADYRLPEPITQALGLDMGNPATPIGAELHSTFASIEPRDLNLREMGVLPSNSAATNDAALEAAIADAPVGSRLVLPYAPEAVAISAAISTQKMLRFSGLGGRAKITQTVWGLPVFDLLNADGSSVEDFDVRMEATRSLIPGTFRDGDPRSYASGVWASGSGYGIARLSASGFTCGVRLTNWDNATGTRTGFASDCVFEDIDVKDVDWGIVGTGWRRVRMRRIAGSYSLTPASSDPSHLVYVSEGQPSQDVSLTSATAFDGTGGHAFQFKGVEGLAVTDIAARNSSGLFSIREVREMDAQGLRSFADLGEPNGSIYVQGAGTERGLRFRDVSLDIVTDTRAIRIDGSDGYLKDATVRVTHVTASENGDVVVNGARNAIENVQVVNAGTGTNAWRAIALVSGDGHRVRGGGGVNVRSFVQVLDAATNASVEYDPKQTTRNPISGARTVATSTTARTTARVRPSRTVMSYTAGTGAGVQIFADDCTHALVSVAGTAAFAVSIVEPHLGAEITVQITNSSGGAMGTITWSGITLASAWTDLANGESRTVRLMHNGTTWRESSRA